MRYAQILSTGRYVPEKVLTNADVERIIGEPVDEADQERPAGEDEPVLGLRDDRSVRGGESGSRAGLEKTAAFKFYPNPVKNILNISDVEIINTAEIYNVVGQKVMAQTVNAAEATLDFSSLQAGTYIVKVATANAVKTIKIAKQ